VEVEAGIVLKLPDQKPSRFSSFNRSLMLVF
jgi:hypothetical protein